MANNALKLENVDAFYGDSHVLRGVSFVLPKGHLLGLIGRNGAGKTTCINTIMGLLPPRAGRIDLFGQPIAGLSPEVIAAKGIALVPQGRRIFRSLSLRENLEVAARRSSTLTTSRWTIERVFETFPRLRDRQNQSSATLSGGEQQMLAIGRALMSNPQVLLMDEPSEGLAPQIVAEVMETIRDLKDQGFSIILVEQNTKLVSNIADDIVILNNGVVEVAATPQEIERSGINLQQHLGVF